MASVRQLLVISSLVIACILISMLAVGARLMDRQLDAQLQTDGENAVATLALLISAQPNAPARARVLDAAFQQGRFSQMALQTPGGSFEFQARRPDTALAEAPRWFSAMAGIQPHEASRQVPEVGKLSLVLDSRPAQDAMWAHMMQWLWLALGIAAFWALFLAALLSRLRRAFADKLLAETPEIKIKDTEPAEDAELLDDVRERVSPSMDEQMARIEQLEIELNRDPVTGLANRAFFLNELKRVLRDDSRQGAVSGYILLVRQRDMARLQNQSDRQEIDDWLRLLGSRLVEVLAEYPKARALPARLNGADFVILFPVGGGPEVMRPVQRLHVLFETLRVKLDSQNLSRWAFALTDYTVQCTPKEVLTRLDLALMCAESAGHTEVEFLSHADHQAGELRMGEASWRTLISQALDNDRLSLDVRRIQYQGDDITERHEASLRLQEDDPAQPSMSGYLFMPAAARLGLSSDCDMRALALALSWLGEHPGLLVIRMSISSVLDTQYLDEMRQVCAFADPALLARLVIELDAYGLSRHLKDFKAFSEGITEMGIQIGLRGLDQEPDALRKIHEANFSYVKLGGSFVHELLSSPGGVQMMVAVTETAIGMGMRVYIDDAEDEATRQMVMEYGALVRET
ncbi:EAL domain-containing protein [Castellaniella sp.]|uniref:EAL domain-containing protein n=1 Tax=Castellaniella sp. TaxID=1955812 RepID=UPI003C71F97E